MKQSCIICFNEHPSIPHINSFCREPITEEFCSCNFYIHSICLRRYLKKYGDQCTMCKKQILLKPGIVAFKDDLIFITVDNEIYKSLDDDDDTSTITTQVITEPICSNENKPLLITIILSILIIISGFYFMF